MLKHRFRVIKRTYYGGIDSGRMSSLDNSTYRLLMREHAVYKFELQQEDIPPANVVQKRSLSANVSFPNTSTDCSVALSASKVPIRDNTSSSTKGTVPPKELFPEGEENRAPDNINANCPMLVSSELQPRSFPAPNVLAISKVIPPADATKKRPFSGDDSKVPIHVIPLFSYKDKFPLKELSHEGEEDCVPAYKKANYQMLVPDEAQARSLPAPNLLATSKVIPPANETKKSPFSGDDSEVPIQVIPLFSYIDALPLKELSREGEEDCTAAHKKANQAVLESDEAQTQTTPATLLAISKTLETMFVPKECHEKQEVTSELMSTKSRVQELEQEIELYKAKRVDSDYRTSQAIVKVKMLEKRLQKVMSDSNCLHNKIKNDATEEFKSSDDFAIGVQEEAVKYYMNGCDACKLRALNSCNLPSGLNFDFLDVADTECGNSPGDVDRAADDLVKKQKNA